MPGPVGRWLETFMCKHYADTFEAFGYKTLQSVCQLQSQQLQAMGVAQEHCDLILENVFVLRQTILANNSKHLPNQQSYNPTVNPASSALRSVAMNSNYQRGTQNHYQEEYHNYGPNGSQMTTSMNYQKHYEEERMGTPMVDVNQRGYGPSYAEHNQMMMQQQHHSQQQQHLAQQQHPQPNRANQVGNMYQQSGATQGYMPQQQYSNQQYPSSYIPQNTTQPNLTNNYYNSSNQQAPTSNQQTPQHHHVRQMQGNTNPQAVADNILQLASSFPSSHTVQVPLNKNRHAPYHVPQPSHYNIQNVQNVNPPSQNQMAMNQHRMYSNSINTSHQQPARTSPISPMPLQSPVSHHSNQSIASPVSMHSPSSIGMRSPAQSPGVGMRSPCGIQAMPSPHGQPMKSPSHVQMGYSQQINSPPHRSGNIKSPVNPHHFSPNPMNAPVSQASLHYQTSNRTVQSPQSNFSLSTSSSPYVNESLQESGQFQNTCSVTNPLQSLQKLVMLPETQVVDPKSVVNDACVPSPQNNDSSKNCDSSAEWLRGDCSHSAGSTDHSSPEEIRPSNACEDGKHCNNTCDTESEGNKEEIVTTGGITDKQTVCDDVVDDISSKETENETSTGSKSKVVEDNSNNEDRKVIETISYNQEKGNGVDNVKTNLLNGLPDKESLQSHEEEVKQKLSPPKKKILTAYNESLLDNSAKKCDIPPKSSLNLVNGSTEPEHEEIPKVTSAPSVKTKEISTDTSCVIIESDDKIKSDKKPVESITKIPSDVSVRKARELSPPKLRSIASDNYSEDSEEELRVRKDCANTYSRVSRLVTNSCSSIEKLRTNSDEDSDDEDFSFDIDEVAVEESDESSDIVSEGVEENFLEEDFDDESDINALREKLNSYTYPDKLSNDTNGSNPVSVHNPSTPKKSPSLNSPEDKSNIEKKQSSKSPPNISADHDSVSISSDEVVTPSKRTKRNPRNTPPILKREEVLLISHDKNIAKETSKRKRKISSEIDSDNFMEKKIKPETIEIIDSSFDEDDDKPLKCVAEIVDTKYTPSTSTPAFNGGKKVHVKTGSYLPSANVSAILKEEMDVSQTSQKKKGRPVGSKNSLKQNKKVKCDKKLDKKKKKVDESRESLKTMKFGKTLSLMKNSKKKSELWQNASPFVRLFGSKIEPTSVVVYDNQQQDEEESKQKKTRGPVSSTVQISNLPSGKSVMVPHSQTLGESNWVCALCGKRSSYKFLGDLFGPYYLDCHVSLVKKQLEDDTKREKSKTPKVTLERRRRKSSDRHSLDSVDKPQEVWVHENCTLWSDGVFLIDSKIYGLEEAVKVASSSNCSGCKEAGAMIGCLHKGCNQKYHYMCAAESKCYLNEDNFSLLCVKHKDKRKRTEASTSKT
ncbi:hypothetical protein SNE40_018508 [Patella caerulea]|uniref:PHD-type domain-containing protein n=1 Tax=Patella caerulea TaxID=87958 RepID=A0AAN8J7F7_PATCE